MARCLPWWLLYHPMGQDMTDHDTRPGADQLNRLLERHETTGE
ncbi:hypothetical protein QF035_009224 [Streptomyces umbrinus]|uniref:Uncharacterized protein n=1 Tax=Streptomyces umbrinus TaxID=67370 RepID=A0ABU0T7V8_9ACTN|nr:hypothetical protein [Streptomyces umbrinus]MDQ1031642.1 hypothetical protein [Streptomyces umbrinus]